MLEIIEMFPDTRIIARKVPGLDAFETSTCSMRSNGREEEGGKTGFCCAVLRARRSLVDLL